MSKKVLVVMGGFSSEREVSLVTGKGVATALRKEGYEVIEHNLQHGYDFISALNKHQPDVVFNALHGTFGEDGCIQGLLDILQIPYTHSNVETSAICMNKVLTKNICQTNGINVTPHKIMTAKEFLSSISTIEIPFVVKPVADGSSVGVFVVKEAKDLDKISYDDDNLELMIEKYIEGQELTVMVLEGQSYVVTELRPTVEFYDYKAKYTGGMTEHIIPADISDEISKLCQDFAKKAHKALGCNTISRSDFRYNPKDGVIFLEINTNPGLTPLSLAPEQAKYAKISYETLCKILVENAKCKQAAQ